MQSHYYFAVRKLGINGTEYAAKSDSIARSLHKIVQGIMDVATLLSAPKKLIEQAYQDSVHLPWTAPHLITDNCTSEVPFYDFSASNYKRDHLGVALLYGYSMFIKDTILTFGCDPLRKTSCASLLCSLRAQAMTRPSTVERYCQSFL